MKLKKNLFYLPLILSIFFVTPSCSSDDDKEENVNNGVPINSLEASSNESLEGRNDWVLNFGNTVNYKFKIDGKTLKATPDSDVQYFNEKCKEGEAYMNGLISSVTISFQPKDYYAYESEIRLLPKYPNILNQNTKDGLIHADILKGSYKGIVKKDIYDIYLKHKNSLLDIELINFPTNYKVKIPFLLYYLNYEPYKVKDNAYRLVYDYVNSSVVCVINQAGVTIEKFDLPEASNKHYSLTIYYNETSNSFTSKSEISEWSDENDVLLKDIN